MLAARGSVPANQNFQFATPPTPRSTARTWGGGAQREDGRAVLGGAKFAKVAARNVALSCCIGDW